MKSKLNIAVFGGQGRTGYELSKLAINAGYNVTVFTHHDNHSIPSLG